MAAHKKKTHSGAAKRFKKVKSGMVKAKHSGVRHILTKKSAKRKRHLRKGFYLRKADRARVAEVL